MRRIYSPHNEIELINLRSILHGEGIPFFVHNDHFGSLEIGPRIELFNAKTIFVPREHAERARELIEDYVRICTDVPTRLSFWHTARMVLEVLLFSWIVPYRKKRIRED